MRASSRCSGSARWSARSSPSSSSSSSANKHRAEKWIPVFRANDAGTRNCARTGDPEIGRPGLMRLAVLKETAGGESRVAATPETAKKFIALGASVAVEEGAGLSAAISDEQYREAGAEVGPRQAVL